jgi:hypothetical protein
MLDQESPHKLFFLEIAEQAAVLLTPQSRAFLAAKCDEFFRVATDCYERERAARQECERFTRKKGYYLSLAPQPSQSGVYRRSRPGHPGPPYIEPVLVKVLPSWEQEDPTALFPYGGASRRSPRDDAERLLRDCVRVVVIHDVEFRDSRTIYFFRDAGPERRTPLNQTPDEFAEWVHRSLLQIAGSLGSKPHGIASLQASFRESVREVQKALGALKPPGEKPAVTHSPDPTPKTDPTLIYQADAAEFYNIPKSTLSKASKKSPGEPGFLWSGGNGKRKWYRKSDLERLSRSRKKLKGA